MDTMRRVMDHFEAAKDQFNKNNFMGIFLRGSQNYGLDNEHSDVDTIIVLTPSFKEMVNCEKPISSTHICGNGEHTDFKDVRLCIDNFRNQSHNCLEILFTPYRGVNKDYFSEWDMLVAERERIARINPYKAVKAAQSMTQRNCRLLTQELDERRDIFKAKGYNPKQLYHMLKAKDFLTKYISGVPYEECIVPSDRVEILQAKYGHFPKDWAVTLGTTTMIAVNRMANDFCSKIEEKENTEVVEFLNEVKEKILRKSLEKELLN